jgi:sugar phosphate isomerase/epimerase
MLRGITNSLIVKKTFIAFLFLALTASTLWAEDSSKVDYPLGVFNFDFARLGADEAAQIGELKSIGYGGLVMNMSANTPKQAKAVLNTLHQYQVASGDDAFSVYAGYVVYYFNAGAKKEKAQNAHIDQVIKSLKKSDSKLWVILRGGRGQIPKDSVKPKQIVEFLRSLAERTKAAGVELVLYPHDGALVETVEEALPYLKEVQNGNVFISLHLCHEIRGGNGDRLNEIAAKIKPWLRLPSINGADIDSVNETMGWKRGIQPLTMGDYDSSKLLDALKSVDYKGPVILHTWGLQKAAADHHHTSYKRFQEMLETKK